MSDQPATHHPVPVKPVDHRLIATWPVGSFVENIAVMPDGRFAIAIHNKREIHHVDRSGMTGLLAALPASPAGLVAVADGLFAVGGDPGRGPHAVYKIGMNGSVEERLRVPDTLFLNGFTPAGPGRAYTVDSIVGMVIEIDLIASTSRVVLRHELLTKISADPMLPGANGIKFGKGGLFMTNTDRTLVLRAELGADGPTGVVYVVAQDLRGDDLALDQDGTLYITNHIQNTLTRLRSNGERVAIAGPDQGMAGCTACVFHPDDPTGLYVTTTGGMIMPLDGVVREAKLVRLETGARGQPVVFQA